MKCFCFFLLFFLSQKIPAQQTILWKIEKEGSTKVSYILGSFHGFMNSFVDSFPLIKEKLSECNAAVFETESDSNTMAEYYNSRPANNKLQSVLSEEDIDFLKQQYAGRKLDILKLTPGELFVYLSNSTPYLFCFDRKKNDKYFMDKYIELLAKENNNKTFYLETDTFQFKLLTKISEKYSERYIKKQLASILYKIKNREVDKSACGFTEEYSSLNLNYFFNQKCREDPSTTGRNNSWMEKLPALLEQNNCFITVGLMHLFYNCGLIMQLRNAGYKVEPVNLK